jgi:hypothetical protein
LTGLSEGVHYSQERGSCLKTARLFKHLACWSVALELFFRGAPESVKFGSKNEVSKDFSSQARSENFNK